MFRGSYFQFMYLLENLTTMADDRIKADRGDDARINVMQTQELNYWADTLGVTADKLKEAVKAVGPMAKDVRQYLKK
jgi:hypothetical protein